MGGRTCRAAANRPRLAVRCGASEKRHRIERRPAGIPLLQALRVIAEKCPKLAPLIGKVRNAHTRLPAAGLEASSRRACQVRIRNNAESSVFIANENIVGGCSCASSARLWRASPDRQRSEIAAPRADFQEAAKRCGVPAVLTVDPTDITHLVVRAAEPARAPAADTTAARACEQGSLLPRNFVNAVLALARIAYQVDGAPTAGRHAHGCACVASDDSLCREGLPPPAIVLTEIELEQLRQKRLVRAAEAPLGRAATRRVARRRRRPRRSQRTSGSLWRRWRAPCASEGRGGRPSPVRPGRRARYSCDRLRADEAGPDAIDAAVNAALRNLQVRVRPGAACADVARRWRTRP
jgi:hypothetical protein